MTCDITAYASFTWTIRGFPHNFLSLKGQMNDGQTMQFIKHQISNDNKQFYNVIYSMNFGGMIHYKIGLVLCKSLNLVAQ